MAALQALVGGLTPPNEDIEILQQVGIIPSTSSSTTTNPYTSGGKPLDPNTGTESTGVLQAIQRLDEKMTGGFAQIMAKLSNTPIRGGGEIKSPQSIEMSAAPPDPAQAAEPSFFNKVTGGIKAATNGITSGVKSLVGTPSNTGTVAAAPETTTLAGGRRKTRKSRNSRRQRRRQRRHSRRH